MRLQHVKAKFKDTPPVADESINVQRSHCIFNMFYEEIDTEKDCDLLEFIRKLENNTSLTAPVQNEVRKSE